MRSTSASFRIIAVALLAAQGLLGPIAGWRCADGKPCPLGFPILQPMPAAAEPAQEMAAATVCTHCPSKGADAPGAAHESGAPSGVTCVFDALKWSATQVQFERAPEPPMAAILILAPELQLEAQNPVIEVAELLGPREARSGPYRGRAPPCA